MNCDSMPTITVCQTIFLRFLEVTHSAKRKTISPKRLTARFSRVLSAVSPDANVPIRMTAIVTNAALGILSFSGIRAINRGTIIFHRPNVGFVTMVTGIYKVTMRNVIASQSKKGTIQPKSYR